MIWSLIKWGIGLTVLAVAILSFAGKKTFHVEIDIPAPPEAVWAVLTDTKSYGEWNPVFIKVIGGYGEGANVTNFVKDPSGKILEIGATVSTFSVARELRQDGGVPGFLTFDHQWLLESVEGGTRVTQHDVDRGFWLWFWDSSWIIPSYTMANEALRKRVMQIAN